MVRVCRLALKAAALWAVCAGGILATHLAGLNLVVPDGLRPLFDLGYRFVYLLSVPGYVAGERLVEGADPHHRPLAHYVVVSALTALGLAGAFAVVWARRRLTRRRRNEGAGLTRRQFLDRAAGAAGGAAAVGLGGYASFVEPQWLRVARYEIPIGGLPAELDGLRVAHVSDTHYGHFISLRYLERVMDRVNALEPDLVLLTGDYVHKTPAAIERGVAVLGRLRPRIGTLAVLGNHDYWEGAEAVRQALAGAGATVLDNARRFVTPAGRLLERPAGPGLCVAGVEDLWDGAPDAESALEGTPADMPRLLMSHNPDYAERLRRRPRVDLMFSGHTHGGQVTLPGFPPQVVPSQYGPKYAGGLVQGPHCRVLVSRGVGMAVLPVRFCVRPEVGLVRLRKCLPNEQ